MTIALTTGSVPPGTIARWARSSWGADAGAMQMPTISRDTLDEVEVTVSNVESGGNLVELRETQLRDLIDRTRALKQHRPALPLPPLTPIRPSRHDEGVIALRHPVHALADLLTMKERSGLPWERIAFCCTGDGSSGITESLMLAGTALGMDVRISAPARFWPAEDVIARAHHLAASTRAGLMITPNLARGAEGAHFLVDVPFDRRQVTTTITETSVLANRPPAIRPLAEEQSVNRLWVLEAVLADWLAEPGSTWSHAAELDA